MSAPKTTNQPEKILVFSWKQLLIHSALFGFCAFLGLLSWYIADPESIRFFETQPEEQLTIKVTPDIQVVLDGSSSLAITDNKPLRIEVLRGNAYFDISSNSTDPLTVKIGHTLINDLGKRFSIRMQKNGKNIISVAKGQLKINTPSGTYLISSFEQADFDGYQVSKHRMISERDVAPWHKRLYDATFQLF